MQMDEIVGFIGKADIRSLATLRAVLKTRDQTLAMLAAIDFHRGCFAEVTLDGKTFRGTVVKVRGNAIWVTDNRGRNWKVSPTAARRVDGLRL